MDHVGLVDDAQRSILVTFLAKDYQDLEEKLRPNTSRMFPPVHHRSHFFETQVQGRGLPESR